MNVNENGRGVGDVSVAALEGASDVVARPLDPLRFPLTGRSLIEASAGTGKTFTIAMLYVRLVLGHTGPMQGRVDESENENEYEDEHEHELELGRDDALDFEAGDAITTPATVSLTPPEILVVTFTDAATKELRDRIRARLSEAAAYFQVPPEDVEPREPGTDLLYDMRDDYPPERWLSCARKLQLAAEWMDEAAVSTIHGWCNRMLREHAFDSDSLFTQSLEADQTELLAEVVRDYWRSFMAPLDASLASVVSNWFADPDALRIQVRSLLDYADALPEGMASADALAVARRDAARELAAIKAPWLAWIDEMEQAIDAAREAGQFGPRRMARANCTKWFAALRVWASDAAQVSPTLTPTAWTQLGAIGLSAECIQGAPPSHEGFAALDGLREALAALPDGRQSVLCHAVRWIARRFDDEQGRRSQMGFNELLKRLDVALHGPNAERLASVIRTQFPVALIDEFQDTDPVQYRIFDTVYREGAASTALIMIGDPKQAIYAFRGADIFTYLAARRACGDRLYTLTRNFRSTREMVAAVNACFAAAERRERGSGAFLFRQAGLNPVPFIEVDAKGRDEQLIVEGQPLRALHAWWLAADNDKGTVTKGAFLERMSGACASEMVRLLNLGQAGRAGFGDASIPGRIDDDDFGTSTRSDGEVDIDFDQAHTDGDVGARRSHGGLRPLRPADMAVLVNNRVEADAIRFALARRGVRTVYLSDKDSVFTSGVAAEIQHWLAACADPDDGRLVRTALATRTLGLSWTELDTLRRDELEWEACVLRFREYRECWRRQGVLPMLRRVLNDYRVPARLLGAPGGERTLTDVLHLSELLQQASTLIEGEHGLIRYLAEERQAAAEGASAGDAQQVRLESDGDLVKVITVHKSKGLEYPLVFLPFGCTFRETKIQDVPLKWHDDEGTLHVELAPTLKIAERADQERLGEDLRKLYVALTRARYATWVGLAPLDGIERSAIGYLLSAGDPLGERSLQTVLDAQWGACAQIAVQQAPLQTDTPFVEPAPDAIAGRARVSVDVVSQPWWIASYSSLRMARDGHSIDAHAAHGYASAADTPDEDTLMELLEAEGEDAWEAEGGAVEGAVDESSFDAQRAALVRNIHEFPRGSDPGTFLHDLLEWTAAEGFAHVVAHPGALRDVVARRCQVRGWERWIDTLTEWLLALVSTPLKLHGLPFESDSGAPISLCLAELDPQTYIAEMEFWVAAHAVDTAELDAAVCESTLEGASRPALERATLNGMLKGFMDLVFEHEGRYYVADYKSNWLGPDDEAYSPQRMRAQILHSRYELQYVLYLFALHRLLKARLPDYDYDEHIGGAVYLFVRGIGALSQGVHIERPPRELIETLDALFSDRAEALADDTERV